MNKKYISLYLSLVLCSLALKGQQKRAITINNYNDQPPIVNDNYMVWRTDENNSFNILVYDFKQDSTYCIASGNNNVFACLNNRYIAWNLQSDTDDEIVIYDTQFGISYPITNNLSDDIHPTICNEYLAWENTNGFESNIMLYDLKRSTLTNVTNYRNNIMPQLDDHYLVWKTINDEEIKKQEIYMYNIETKDIARISTHKEICNVKIKNGYIAWIATDDNDSEIFLYQIKDKKRIQVTNNIVTDNYLDLSPPYLVFSQNDGDDEIMLYNIKQEATTRLTDNDTDDFFPVLNNDKIAWFGYSGYGMEEYLYEIARQKTRQITHSGGSNLHVTLNKDYIIWCAWDEIEQDSDIFIYPIPESAGSPPNINANPDTILIKDK